MSAMWAGRGDTNTIQYSKNIVISISTF